MKKLRVRLPDQPPQQPLPAECEEIVVELDHGRSVTIKRGLVGGVDGLTLDCGIEREERLANARFVIRTVNFGCVHLAVEQAK